VKTTWPALALDRFLSEPKLSPYVGVFGAFDVRDCEPFWRWLADAPSRSVVAWCRRMERASWWLPASPDPRRDLPWSLNSRGKGGAR